MKFEELVSFIFLYKGWILGCLVIAVYLCFRARTPVGKPMRRAPGEGVPVGESSFIESLGANGEPVHSCSFIEFDGRGDYLDFEQHKQAWQKVKELASLQPLILVFYCHGWKNNSQSYDVVKFNDFLGRLASSHAVTDPKYRVHGVYLGWRGNLYHPFVDKSDKTGESAYLRTGKQFGAPIVSPRWGRRFQWPYRLQENVSYWSRLRAATDDVSGIPMARSIYQCANLVKSIDREQERTIDKLTSSRVLVMGHSFGSLVLERALYATCLDPLVAEWSLREGSTGQRSVELPVRNPLPLDFVIFVNSAAPSLYAKAMQDFLAAHQRAMEPSHTAFAPILISITSSADWATRYAHPAANVLSRFYPSLHRVYTSLLKIKEPCRINQSWFSGAPPVTSHF